MKKLVCNLYYFDELSEDAKHRVCQEERYRDYNLVSASQELDADERIATLDAFCKVFGIKYEIDYDHCHRFISWHFNGDFDNESYDISGKHLLRFLNVHYYDIRSRKFYYKHHFTKSRKSRIQWVEQNCPFTGMCYDCDILDKIFEWYKHPNWDISLHDLFDDCFSHYLRLWEEDDDYRMSDESIGEMILANWEDKLYFEDGTEFTGDYDEVTEYLEEAV